MIILLSSGWYFLYYALIVVGFDGCVIPHFLSQNDSLSILSGNAFPQDCARGPLKTPLFIKGFGKIYKFYFCSHSSYNSPINLISSPDCCLCIGLLVDTHIGPILSHKAIGGYGHNPKIWPYGHMA